MLEFQSMSFSPGADIRVCGVGQAGLQALSIVSQAHLDGVQLIAISSDEALLASSPASVRIRLGNESVSSYAHDADPALAREFASARRDEIAAALEGADLLFILAGLGGLVGCGAAPVVARFARESGILTMALVTFPFAVEGGNRVARARESLQALEKDADSVLVIPKDRLMEIQHGALPFAKAQDLPGELLATGVRIISSLILKPGLINIDFADIRTIMQQGGSSLIGLGRAEGDNRAVDAAQLAIQFPMLGRSRLAKASRCIVHVLGGTDLGMGEVHQAVLTVQKSSPPDCHIIFGTTIDDAPHKDVEVAVFAAGLGADVDPLLPVETSGDTRDQRAPESGLMTLESAEPRERHIAPAAEEEVAGPIATSATRGEPWPKRAESRGWWNPMRRWRKEKQPPSYDAFISYRREGAPETARAIREKLLQYGIRSFLDVEDLGRHYFDERLLREIEHSPNFILVLSQGCLDGCWDEKDWLRREIEHALRTDRNIVPVMKDGFTFPPREKLPPALSELPRYQCVEYSLTYFQASIDRLLNFLVTDR